LVEWHYDSYPTKRLEKYNFNCNAHPEGRAIYIMCATGCSQFYFSVSAISMNDAEKRMGETLQNKVLCKQGKFYKKWMTPL
jgi:hypothetical protein